MLNSDSRNRSAVGRISREDGEARLRPFNRPPTTRISVRSRQVEARAPNTRQRRWAPLPLVGSGGGRGWPRSAAVVGYPPPWPSPKRGEGTERLLAQWKKAERELQTTFQISCAQLYSSRGSRSRLP